MLRPLHRCLGAVECLPWNRLADSHFEFLIPVLEHLVAQIEHRDVEFYTQHPVYVCKTVEELGVLTLEMYGYYIALCLHTLCNESLLPFEVTYHTLSLAGTETCRKHYNMVIARECRIDLLREIACLLACLVYGYPER